MSKQCFEQAHMTCAEFGLWVQYQKLAYKSGRLFCDGRRTAERFTGESKDHIYRLRRSLVTKGWLEVVKGSERDKATQRVTVTEFRVLDHTAWVKKHGKKECKTSLFSSVEPVAPVQMAEEEPVAPVQMPCRTRANEPVAPARHSTKETSAKVKTELQSVPTAKQTPTDILKSTLLGGTQSVRIAEPTIPPFAPVQMDPHNEEGAPAALASVDAFTDLAYEAGYGWGARRGIGRALTPEEITELKRRNTLRLTITDFSKEETPCTTL
jgi:hypothetical protein